MEKLFPVQALNQNITQNLNKIRSADILGNVQNGLNPEIHLIDKGTPISEVSCIVKFTLENEVQVKISAAYCQFLWLLCCIVIREIDFNVIKESCNQFGTSLEQFSNGLKLIENLPKEQLQGEIRKKSPDFNSEKYNEFLKLCPELLNIEQFQKQQNEYFDLLCELIGVKEFNLDDFSIVDLKSAYAKKINSVYCFGICFILLHELYHFSLGHLDIPHASQQDEKNADIGAFWDINSDINQEEKFSAYCGILCVFFSLLYLNPTLESDGIHPYEDERIFDIYECIKDDNTKYTQLVINFFVYWDRFFPSENFPKDLDFTSESVYKIKQFFQDKRTIK